MNEVSCKGVKKWGEYCKEFERRWKRAMEVTDETVEGIVRTEGPFLRLEQANKELSAALEQKISEGARMVKEAEEIKNKMMEEIE